MFIGSERQAFDNKAPRSSLPCAKVTWDWGTISTPHISLDLPLWVLPGLIHQARIYCATLCVLVAKSVPLHLVNYTVVLHDDSEQSENCAPIPRKSTCCTPVIFGCEVEF